jgi:hypothetical protein
MCHAVGTLQQLPAAIFEFAIIKNGKKHINTLYGQNVELLNVKLAVHMVTSGL